MDVLINKALIPQGLHAFEAFWLMTWMYKGQFRWGLLQFKNYVCMLSFVLGLCGNFGIVWPLEKFGPYKWLPINPNMDNPTSRLIGSPMEIRCRSLMGYVHAWFKIWHTTNIIYFVLLFWIKRETPVSRIDRILRVPWLDLDSSHFEFCVLKLKFLCSNIIPMTSAPRAPCIFLSASWNSASGYEDCCVQVLVTLYPRLWVS